MKLGKIEWDVNVGKRLRDKRCQCYKTVTGLSYGGNQSLKTGVQLTSETSCMSSRHALLTVNNVQRNISGIKQPLSKNCR
jgi:hypothetical protein